MPNYKIHAKKGVKSFHYNPELKISKTPPVPAAVACLATTLNF
jgi:hypothetical protein